MSRYWLARRLRALALELDSWALRLEQRADLELELKTRTWKH